MDGHPPNRKTETVPTLRISPSKLVGSSKWLLPWKYEDIVRSQAQHREAEFGIHSQLRDSSTAQKEPSLELQETAL